MKILVTGAAGFIGFHLCKYLIEKNIYTIGVDNFNSYYDIKLKRSRAKVLEKSALKRDTFFKIEEISLENNNDLKTIFDQYNFTHVVNLAAQAGVRYSLENPSAYINSNLVGFGNIIELCKLKEIKHFIYASSSSVYGGNNKIPFEEADPVDHPVSLYAATKRANELIAHSYSHLFNLPTTGLRFFTVYGPWGRPDMALFLFTESIIKGEKIKLFNNGQMSRDFTYIDDIVESIYRVINKPPIPNNFFNSEENKPNQSWSPFKIFNIGNSNKTELMQYVEAIENHLSIKAKKEMLPMQPGDVENTAADTESLEKWIGFKPNTSIKDGIGKFIQWYKKYYGIEDKK